MGIREGTAVMVLALALTACESGFSEADIEQTKQTFDQSTRNGPD